MKLPKSAGFRGFSPVALTFLRGLAIHNDRTWFGARKHIYESELLAPLGLLVADASDALRKANIPIAADPQRPAFRIYRDIRFSRDKSPYKINLGAYLPRSGERDRPGGLYVHIQPKQSFMAVAYYELDTPLLARWRAAMAKDPKRFQAMQRALRQRGLKIAEEHETLKRMPRGYEAFADSPIAKYFRMDSFTVGEKLSDRDVQSPKLVDKIVALAKKARPFLDYGDSVL